MVKFPIQNIEANLDSNALLIGESILDRSEFVLTQVEKNLWLTRIDKFEIEIQLAGKKVKAYSCECPAFGADHSCGHVVAALFALRRELDNRKDQKIPEKKKSAQRLTVNDILNGIEKEDLVAFIRQYARKNRLFGLALKVRFAAAIQHPDSQEKYNELFDSISKYVISRQGTISPQATKHLAGFIEILNNQAEDEIAMDHYIEANDLLQAMLIRMMNIARKCQNNGQELFPVLLKTCAKLQALSAKQMPPDMRNNIWGFCHQNFPKTTAKYLGISGQLLSTALSLSDENTKKDQVLEVVGEELKRAHTIDYKMELINCLIPYIPGDEKIKLDLEKVLRAQSDYLLLLRSSEVLLSAKIPDLAMIAAKQALAEGVPVDLHLAIRKSLLESAEQLGLADEIFENAIWLFNETGEARYFNLCKSCFEGVSQQRLKFIKDQLEFNHEHFLELSLFAFKEDWQGMLYFIEQKGSLPMLIKFIGPMSDNYSEATLILVKNLFDRYLISHFGPIAAKQVRAWLAEIKKTCKKSFYQNIRSFLQRNYPEKLHYQEPEF